MTRILLENIDLGCDYQSPIECFPSSAAYILTYFDLHTVNPYLNLLVREYTLYTVDIYTGIHT